MDSSGDLLEAFDKSIAPISFDDEAEGGRYKCHVWSYREETVRA